MDRLIAFRTCSLARRKLLQRNQSRCIPKPRHLSRRAPQGACPQRPVFVAGVEGAATVHKIQPATGTLVSLLKCALEQRSRNQQSSDSKTKQKHQTPPNRNKPAVFQQNCLEPVNRIREWIDNRD